MFSVQITHADPEVKTLYIIFDEAHMQHYTYDTFKSAMKDLNTTFDTNTINYEFQVIINKDKFNSSNLQGADLLMISNPGSVASIPATEKDAVNSFVKNGGGVLYMSNPITDNKLTMGNGTALAALTVDGLNANILQSPSNSSTDTTGYTTTVVNDFNNDGNITHVFIDSKYINSDTLKTETNNVSRILYYGAAIDDKTPTIFGNSSFQTYTVDNKFNVIDTLNGKVKWFDAKEIGDLGGRALMIGSTIMFTNSSYDATTSWIDQMDNKLLFENIIAWLSNVTPLNKPADTINKSFGSLITDNLLAAFAFTIGLIALSFIIFVRRKAYSSSKIFDFKVPTKAKTEKSDKETKTQTSGTPTKKVRNRRKRT